MQVLAAEVTEVGAPVQNGGQTVAPQVEYQAHTCCAEMNDALGCGFGRSSHDGPSRQSHYGDL
ncbi:hypothetical protein GCM10010320_63140 [Streptomyces caelestis]|nr:hypothetical protein GCM10010320_63140 [Streptomyces caelestis]